MAFPTSDIQSFRHSEKDCRRLYKILQEIYTRYYNVPAFPSFFFPHPLGMEKRSERKKKRADDSFIVAKWICLFPFYFRDSFPQAGSGQFLFATPLGLPSCLCPQRVGLSQKD
ncbi:hypothetical protein CDAR_589541 [Caerostris darwini]|uniref:Maturase K n=1 Tax=Caerostris darwini TaxID=1538125 RepID=A0AAV4QZL9_9ARAC|nr:hypothetical protein CDAR_589541 [Caerostris darwini]